MVISIYMKIDQVMIKEILGIEAVGQYATATKLSEAVLYSNGHCIITFSSYYQCKETSKKLYLSRLQKLYDLMVWMAICSNSSNLYSDWLINLLYGAQYSQAGGVLTICIWAGFLFLGLAFSRFLTAENWTKKLFIGLF